MVMFCVRGNCPPDSLGVTMTSGLGTCLVDSMGDTITSGPFDTCDDDCDDESRSSGDVQTSYTIVEPF